MSNEERPEDGTSSLTGFPAGMEGTGPLARPALLALGRFQPCVCVSTMTCDVIHPPTWTHQAPSGQGKCILERASYQSHSPVCHCQVHDWAPLDMGLIQVPAMEDRKVLCLQVGYFIRAVRPEQSPVESPLPSWKIADTPPAPATLMHFLPEEAIGFGTQFVEIRPDPSPDRDVPLSAQHELSNGAGGPQ